MIGARRSRFHEILLGIENGPNTIIDDLINFRLWIDTGIVGIFHPASIPRAIAEEIRHVMNDAFQNDFARFQMKQQTVSRPDRPLIEETTKLSDDRLIDVRIKIVRRFQTGWHTRRLESDVMGGRCSNVSLR